MMLFEYWMMMFINEALWIICTYSSIFSRDFYLERVVLVQKLTTWVKFTLALIYNQLYLTDYIGVIVLFQRWIKMVNNEVLWIIFTYSSLFCWCIYLKISMFPKLHNPFHNIPISKTLQPGSNSHLHLSIISYPYLIIPIEWCSLNIEWWCLLMKPFELYVPIPQFLVEIFIWKGLFWSKNLQPGLNSH